MLSGKRILLGVSGSIAAYKAAILIRLLIKSGAEVKVVMTASAHDFITPSHYPHFLKILFLLILQKSKANGITMLSWDFGLMHW